MSYIDQLIDPLWSRFRSFVIIPFYRLIFFADLRIRKTIASTRGVFFLFFTSKYTLHILLATAAIPMMLIHFRSASAAVDVGQRSILYALVTNGEESLVQEGLTETDDAPRRYLTDSLEEEPGIDFDLESDDEYAFADDRGIAGVIAYQPQPTDESVAAPTPPADILAGETSTNDTPPASSSEKRPLQMYTVRPGDTIATIARRHGVSQETIFWANNLTSKSTLKIGAEIKILPVTGVLHTVKRGETLAQIAHRYGVASADISSANAIGKVLPIGTELVVPNGKPAPKVIVAQAPAETPNSSVAPQIKKTPVATRSKTPKVVGRVSVKPDVPITKIRNKAYDIYQELSNSKEDTRTVPDDKEESAAKKKSKLLWPTRLTVVNQYYGWNHTGLDIDGDYTDPIYASEDGVVMAAGWNSGGYGLQIVIDHPTGIRTRYAHASKLFVSAGEEVKRGQVIGYVGTTGRSTGTHLHYEVYDNGKRKNPLAYTR